MLKYRSFENLTQGSTHLNTLPFLPAFSSAFRIKYCPTLFFSSRNFKGCHKKVQDHFLSTSIICSAYRIPASNSSGNLGFLNWKHESKCGISGEILVVGWTWVRAVGCRWGFSINSNFVYIWWSDSLIVNLEVLFATLLEKLFWRFQWSRGSKLWPNNTVNTKFCVRTFLGAFNNQNCWNCQHSHHHEVFSHFFPFCISICMLYDRLKTL